MTREQMILELKAAGIRAVPTVMTYDMGMQYDYITSEGAGTSLGGMGSWPLWKFNAIPKDRWQQIKQAIEDKTLTPELLEGTGLDVMLSDIYIVESQTIDYSDFLSGLADLGMPTSDYYCLYDTGMLFSETVKPLFYLDEKEAKAAFAKSFCYNIETWDNMDDDTVENWYERLTDDLERMSYMEVDEG